MQNTDQKIYSNNGNEAVLDQITTKNVYVLDVGCGNGDNAQILKGRGCIVDGITLSLKEAESVSNILRNVYIHNLEKGLPDVEEKYDYVICSHVLEHIGYPEKLLYDIYKSLKQDGKLVVALPNVMHYKFRIELLKGNFPFEESGIWDYTHLRWYTFDSAKTLLIQNGFKIEKAFVDGDVPLLSIFNFVPKRIRHKVYEFLSSISKGFFGGQLIYVATK
jgi:2-polyprenyl-3-methyl-5-hydroxy-6-metoxy-1,4-benzoquinol methylase